MSSSGSRRGWQDQNRRVLAWAGPEGTNVFGGVLPGAEAGEGKRRHGKAGRSANQGAAASGGRALMLPAPGF